MQYTKLWPSETAASRLGFGASQLMGRVGKTASLRALDTAFGLGINYIDVARSYGYGEAEQVVGCFLRGKRDRVILATKFGIEAAPMGKVKRVGKSLVRPLFRAVPAIRRAAQNTLGAQYRPNVLSVEVLRRSLDTSLRELKTDYIDVYLLHSCTTEVFADDELFATLQSLVQAGKIRHFGLATDTAVILHALNSSSIQFSVAQFEFGLLDQRASQLLKAAVPRPLVWIAHSAYGGGGASVKRLQQGLATVADSEAIPAQLRMKLLRPTPEITADVAINAVLLGTGVNVVLCSMLHDTHLKQNASVVGQSTFTEEELRCIRDAFLSPRQASQERRHHSIRA